MEFLGNQWMYKTRLIPQSFFALGLNIASLYRHSEFIKNSFASIPEPFNIPNHLGNMGEAGMIILLTTIATNTISKYFRKFNNFKLYNYYILPLALTGLLLLNIAVETKYGIEHSNLKFVACNRGAITCKSTPDTLDLVYSMATGIVLGYGFSFKRPKK